MPFFTVLGCSIRRPPQSNNNAQIDSLWLKDEKILVFRKSFVIMNLYELEERSIVGMIRIEGDE